MGLPSTDISVANIPMSNSKDVNKKPRKVNSKLLKAEWKEITAMIPAIIVVIQLRLWDLTDLFITIIIISEVAELKCIILIWNNQ